MFVENKQRLLVALNQLRPRLRSLGVYRLGLFGSFAKDEPHPDSDIDLLIEILPGRKDFDTLMTVGELLEQHLGRRVELVTPESLSRHVAKTITAEVAYVDISA